MGLARREAALRTSTTGAGKNSQPRGQSEWGSMLHSREGECGNAKPEVMPPPFQVIPQIHHLPFKAAGHSIRQGLGSIA